MLSYDLLKIHDLRPFSIRPGRACRLHGYCNFNILSGTCRGAYSDKTVFLKRSSKGAAKAFSAYTVRKSRFTRYIHVSTYTRFSFPVSPEPCIAFCHRMDPGECIPAPACRICKILSDLLRRSPDCGRDLWTPQYLLTGLQQLLRHAYT